MPVLVNKIRNEMITVLRPPHTFSVLRKIFIKTPLKSEGQPLGPQLSKTNMKKDSPIGIETNLESPSMFRPNIVPISTWYHKTGYINSISPHSPKGISPPKNFLVLSLLSRVTSPFTSINSNKCKNFNHLNYKLYYYINNNNCKLKLISSMHSLDSFLKSLLVKLFIHKSSLTKCIQNTGMLCY